MLDINIFRKAPFGKLYKTRDGRKAIFVGRKSKYLYYLIVEGSPKYLTYFEYGRRFEDNASNELSDFDIVGDWDSTIKKEKFHIPNEVKEVNLEKEIKEVKHNYKVDDNRHTSICSADIEWLAKHFFELGLKVQKGE